MVSRSTFARACLHERPASPSPRTIRPGHAAWPSRLGDLHDPPALLHLCGDETLLARRIVAIVGARAASQTGRELAYGLARDLAGAGIAVVSGLARGIDRAAHEGAQSVSGPTVAVLGTGLDVCYPADSKRVYRELVRTGLLVSEFEAGAPPLRAHFPQRNRLIAALAEIVIVVEGAAKSGSRITADLALDLGRDVMAVPRDPLSAGAETPNGLLRQGAAPVTCAADVLEVLGLERRVARNRRSRITDVPERLEWLWKLLDHHPRSAEEIGQDAARPHADLLAALFELEILDLVERVGPGGYRRRSLS